MRAELTVDLPAIRRNWRALAARAAPADCAAVVKADAYGLGAAAVAPALAAEGARIFFTALPEEGLSLREVLGEGPEIWCFNGPCSATALDLLERGVRPLLNDPGQAALARETARAAGRPYPCGLQFDTGMNRLGLEADEIAALLEDDGLAGLDIGLLLSHLACADQPQDPMNAEQNAAFEAITAAPPFGGLRRSLAATGGVLLGADYAHDLVRPGIGLYGGAPFAEGETVVRLDLPVLQIRAVAPGESVGYGAAWRAERPARIATVAAGYADGVIRAAGSRAVAVHRGRRLPFAGRVSMDLITLDASAAPDLAAGDRVELLGPSQPVDALAAAAGTIGYEILTSLGPRYARRYEGADQQ